MPLLCQSGSTLSIFLFLTRFREASCTFSSPHWCLSSLDSLVPELPVLPIPPPLQPSPHHPGLGIEVSLSWTLNSWQSTPRKDQEEDPQTDYFWSVRHSIAQICQTFSPVSSGCFGDVCESGDEGAMYFLKAGQIFSLWCWLLLCFLLCTV